MRWAWHVAGMARGGILEEERPLGKPRCRWEKTIKTVLRDKRGVGKNWINPA
jgi:hypothetical protein